MINVQYLQPDDIILPNDLVRRRFYLSQDSDHINWEDVRKIVNWHKASDFMPPWIGKTLREFHAGVPTSNHGSVFLNAKWPLEIIRVPEEYIIDILHIVHDENCIAYWLTPVECNCEARKRKVL